MELVRMVCHLCMLQSISTGPIAQSYFCHTALAQTPCQEQPTQQQMVEHHLTTLLPLKASMIGVSGQQLRQCMRYLC
ncbi:hypothetical protein F4821DRAFT_241297 [Hypoxylon rubiginosum]|uniref:Uncharacterized protein n=1 Tax=Hypoxylon rubiginosum TaxID=110542 RepID=A0ACC0CYJ1_9PEZI|nr:hypothetical protein F4821DRAFT_241297 [Hypoxylon rubiginosum]